MAVVDDVLGLPAVAEGLFTWPSAEPALVGGRCPACRCVTFPMQASCPRCTAGDMVPETLPRRGRLWTWTVQGFRPKSPPYAGTETLEEFTPYGVGYVDLGDVRVEGRLTESRPDRLRIGMEMEVVALPFGAAVTYAFAPLEAAR
jgi:uncharacterized OB-fold protein